MDPTAFEFLLKFKLSSDFVELFLKFANLPKGSMIKTSNFQSFFDLNTSKFPAKDFENADNVKEETQPNEILTTKKTERSIANDTIKPDNLNEIRKGGRDFSKSISALKKDIMHSTDDNKEIITTSYSTLNGLDNYKAEVTVIEEPEFSNKFIGDFNNFLEYFRSRYEKLSSFFRGNRRIGHVSSIKRFSTLKENDKASIIGIVNSKDFYTAGGGGITLEDPESQFSLSAIINKKNGALLSQAKEILDDTIICVLGSKGKGNIMYVNEIILPQVPPRNTPNKATEPVHVAFLSDIHVGSKKFLKKPFSNFIKFLNGKYGSEKARKLGLQTKYVIFAGDIIDGVGIYPDQEKELDTLDVKEQYERFADFIKTMPSDVQVIIIPGNHDHVRPAKPQPPISEEHAESLHKLENVHLPLKSVYSKLRWS